MQIDPPFIVTVDGPTASGKTSLAKAIASKFGMFHLKGGTFLRAFAYFVIQSGCDPDNETELKLLLEKFELKITTPEAGLDYKILLQDAPIEQHLWTPAVDEVVSKTSRPQSVRIARIEWKRQIARDKSIIADGRTLGSEVFPQADIKIYLTANLEQRALRRHIQLKANGTNGLDLSTIRKSISDRDASDAIGAVDRTVIYPDQIIIDSTSLSFNKTFKLVSKLITSLFGQLDD